MEAAWATMWQRCPIAAEDAMVIPAWADQRCAVPAPLLSSSVDMSVVLDKIRVALQGKGRG